MGKCLFMRKGETHTAPLSGIKASALAVGSTVKLMENGSPVDYLVVNQGIPSASSLYDSSCNGTWLLRKDVYEKRQWHSSNVNDYANSTIHAYLNSTFLGLFDTNTQKVIQQAKIPYRPNRGYSTTCNTGANGLSTKVFLLSYQEVGSTSGQAPNDGAKLSYFNISDSTQLSTKRIAYMSGTAQHWWLRSPYCNSGDGAKPAWFITTGGDGNMGDCSYTYGVRPALILPSNAVFDKDTLILKGVA